MSDIMPKLDKVDRGRNFEKGKEAFVVGQCVKCHRMGDEGGAVGPDLTSVASRFDRRAILESIIEPSKVLSEQYMNERIVTVGGKTVVGRIVDDTPEKIAVQPDPLSIDRVEIKKNEIEIREVSKVSPMPEHLVDMLTEEEILDLLAYLESSANKRSRLFQK
jgi:putative heme-binding domain-containing protein